eukprot:9693086-Lingulodinium_polyedra.AAC.1
MRAVRVFCSTTPVRGLQHVPSKADGQVRKTGRLKGGQSRPAGQAGGRCNFTALSVRAALEPGERED